MTFIQMLKQDHDRVKRDLEKLLNEDRMDETKLKKVCQDLQVHMTIEEEILYPRMEKVEEVEDLIRDSWEEHNESKQVVKRLQSQDLSDEECQEEIRTLLDLVEHHIEEEESELFPVCEDVLSRDEIDNMTKRMEALKTQEQKQIQKSSR